MPFPPLEIVNTVVPASAPPEAPARLLRIVIWPPVLNVSRRARTIVTASLLYDTLNFVIGCRIRSTFFLTRFLVTLSTW